MRKPLKYHDSKIKNPGLPRIVPYPPPLLRSSTSTWGIEEYWNRTICHLHIYGNSERSETFKFGAVSLAQFYHKKIKMKNSSAAGYFNTNLRENPNRITIPSHCLLHYAKIPLLLQWFIFVSNSAEEATRRLGPIFFRFVFRSSVQKFGAYFCSYLQLQLPTTLTVTCATNCLQLAINPHLAWKMNKTYNESGTSGPCVVFFPAVFSGLTERTVHEWTWWKVHGTS